MSTLERVNELRNQGLVESQIIDSLRQEGIKPKEINEALSQSKIKTEISQTNPQQNFQEQTTQNQQINQPAQLPPLTSDPQMQPSISQTNPGYPQNQQYIPGQQISPQQRSQGQQSPIPQPLPQEQVFPTSAPGPSKNQYPEYTGYETAQEYYPEYQQYPSYEPQQGTDIDTINDISEQIVEEKLVDIKKQIRSFSRLKEDMTIEIQKMNLRVERLEKVFNELQSSILRKVGDYGEDIKNISKELHATQDTFSKIVDPLSKNIRKLKEISKSSKDSKKKTNSKSKKSDNVEDFLR